MTKSQQLVHYQIILLILILILITLFLILLRMYFKLPALTLVPERHFLCIGAPVGHPGTLPLTPLLNPNPIPQLLPPAAVLLSLFSPLLLPLLILHLLLPPPGPLVQGRLLLHLFPVGHHLPNSQHLQCM